MAQKIEDNNSGGGGGGNGCKTRENSKFRKNGKTVISVKTENFSRSQMMKRTSPLESSHEIELPRQISSNSETVEISHFSRHWGPGAVKQV